VLPPSIGWRVQFPWETVDGDHCSRTERKPNDAVLPFPHRIVFPLEGNLYGRSISAAAPPHRFLPSPKAAVYAKTGVENDHAADLALGKRRPAKLLYCADG
jgi:hypothetical protein